MGIQSAVIVVVVWAGARAIWDVKRCTVREGWDIGATTVLLWRCLPWRALADHSNRRLWGAFKAADGASPVEIDAAPATPCPPIGVHRPFGARCGHPRC